MKNKLLILMGIIGAALVFFGSLIIFSKPISNKDEPKKLRKITEEEISHNVAHEIVEFYALKETELKDEKILKTKLVADDENGEYIIRVELQSTPGELKETTMVYLGNGEWKVNFPLGKISDYSDKYTRFWPESLDEE